MGVEALWFYGLRLGVFAFWGFGVKGLGLRGLRFNFAWVLG